MKEARNGSSESMSAVEKAYIIAVMIAIVGQCLDCFTTLYGVSLIAPGMQVQEINPIVSGLLRNSRDVFIFLKLVAAPVILALAAKNMWDTGQEKGSLLFLRGMNVLQTAVVLSNAVQIYMFHNNLL